ncbi:MAG: YjbH domain-containing protein, partial [Anaerolineae bacterium]
FNRFEKIALVSIVVWMGSCYAGEFEAGSLFYDLNLVAKIDQKIKEELPFFYNASLVGGYLNMPSARVPKTGQVAFGGGRLPPYNIYGVAFQIYDRIELSANYRVFTDLPERNFGHEGFGDDADRIGNIKIVLNLPSDGFRELPSIAFGADDFIGTRRFNAQYAVVTKEWLRYHLELSLGYSKGRIKGFFGGFAWTPFRTSSFFLLKDLSIVGEYDAIRYKKHAQEHPNGRSFKTRFNGGLIFVGWETLQLSVSSLRGEEIAASATLRYPLGKKEGVFPKIDDPKSYSSPVDIEPIGVYREGREFTQELAYALSDQGIDLLKARLEIDGEKRSVLWLRVVNNRYREEAVFRKRLQDVLAALIPSNVYAVIVDIEADALISHSYRFYTEYLYRYRKGSISEFELETLSPMQEAVSKPSRYDSVRLFDRRKAIWTFTILPNVLSFFGSAKGKFKYSVGMTAIQEGYLVDDIYYRLQAGYSIHSSMSSIGATDRLNPSHLPNVRTDTLRYYQTNRAILEQAFMQRSWNIKKGFFYRLATGYFESAYGGIANEVLYYPVGCDFAIGAEVATVLKRRYEGIAFTRKIRKIKGHTPRHIHFFGLQYFLDFHYHFKPLGLDFTFNVGQFLAKDKGVRTEIGRRFANGLKVSIWYTVTNGHDKVNGHTYYDKGVSFSLPLDFFLKQSSRTFIGYSMAAWLRDVGARSESGKRLYDTLYEERYD